MIGRTEDGRFIMSGRPTSAIIQALPNLEGARRWLKSRDLVCEATEHNKAVLTRAGVTWRVPQPAQAKPPAVYVSAYTPKTKPYPHQLTALRHMQGKAAFALFMEQGTGKTKVMIDRACELYMNGAITGVLVVSKKGVHRQWIDSELPVHCGVPWMGEHWDGKTLHPNLNESGRHLKWAAFNYDGLKSKTGEKFSESFCRAHKGKLMIIADESQEIKNASSGRHKALTKLAAWSSHRALATGTPIAKDLMDEWAQLKWLDEDIIGIRYKTAFMRRYCVMGGFQNRAVIGHVNVEDFKERTAPYVYRATKDEIGILPKQYNTWTFDLSDAQRTHIKELKKEFETTLQGGELVLGTLGVTRLLRIQQICSGFAVDEDECLTEVMSPATNPRLNAMCEWLEAGEGKALIWFRFREEARLIADRLRQTKVDFVEYHGGTNDKDRASAVASFMNPNGAQVFIANPQSAGTGLNLQGLCSRALYFSNSFSAIDRWQSEDRIHRIGTKNIVTFTDLIGKGAIDHYILRNLQKKKSLSKLVLDDIREILGDLE